MKKYETSKYVALFVHPYNTLLEICKTRNIYVDPSRKYSKTEIIMMIAMDGTHAECTPQRNFYRMTSCDNTYFVKLTDQQVSFFHWLDDQNILPSDSDLEESSDIKYEEP